MYQPKEHAKYIIRIWTEEFAGVQPVKFSDVLAEVFFFSAIVRALEFAYKVGRRDEQKARKKKAVMRWKKRNQTFRG